MTVVWCRLCREREIAGVTSKRLGWNVVGEDVLMRYIDNFFDHNDCSLESKVFQRRLCVCVFVCLSVYPFFHNSTTVTV